MQQVTHRNLEVIWLMKKLRPDFKTIADFRKENVKAFKKVFRQFTILCHDLEMFFGKLVAIVRSLQEFCYRGRTLGFQ